MTNTNSIPVLSGRGIGVLRLRELIDSAKKARASKKRNDAADILKREFNIKGATDRVIAIAEVSLANVAHW